MLERTAYELPPSDDERLLEIVQAIVAREADCPLDKVRPDDDIYTEIGVRSLETIAIFIELSGKFGVPEPMSKDQFLSLNTPRKIAQYVRRTPASVPEARPQTIDHVSTDGIISLLPYGDDFRFIEEVRLLQSQRIVCTMTWAINDPRIIAHFARGPHIVPGVLLAEQVSQSALLLAKVEKRLPTEGQVVLAQLRCDFLAPAVAPCLVESDVTIQWPAAGGFGFMGTCRVNGAEVAQVQGIAMQGLRKLE